MIDTRGSKVEYRSLKAVPPRFHPGAGIWLSNFGPRDVASWVKPFQNNMFLVGARTDSPPSMALLGNKGFWINIPSAHTSTLTPRLAVLAVVRDSNVSKCSQDTERGGFPNHTRGRVLKTTRDLITPAQPDDGTAESESGVT